METSKPVKFKLLRTKQCAKCPWRVSTNPYEIPDGYCEIKHRALKETVCNPGEIRLTQTKVFACHHSTDKKQMYCIGWLYNQLGRGNNIALRLKMMHCENIGDMKIIGEQHQTFEQTLPKHESTTFEKDAE